MHRNGFNDHPCFFKHFSVVRRFPGHKDGKSRQHERLVREIGNLPSLVKKCEPYFLFCPLNTSNLRAANDSIAFVLDVPRAGKFGSNDLAEMFGNILLLLSRKMTSLAADDDAVGNIVDHIRDHRIILHTGQQGAKLEDFVIRQLIVMSPKYLKRFGWRNFLQDKVANLRVSHISLWLRERSDTL